MSDGDAAYKSGDYNLALSDFQQAASAPVASDQARAYYHEALAYHKLREDAKAVSAYQEAQAKDPTLAFASTPSAFAHNLQVAQADAGSTASTSTASSSAVTATTDPAAIALANGDVYVAPELAGQVNQTRLTEASEADGQTGVKIAVLDRLPAGYTSTAAYAHRLHDYLNLGNAGLIVVAVHGQGAGVADVARQLSAEQERTIAQKYVSQIGAGNYTQPLSDMAHDIASAATTAYYGPIVTVTWICVFLVALFIVIMIIRSRSKRVEINSMRGPLEKERDSIIAGIEQIDNYADVLPKNNADSDQVRAFRQAAAYKVEQAEKIMARSTEIADMNRAQALLDQAGADVINGRRYLDRATGGSGVISEEPVKPIPFPTTPEQLSQVPADERGVSFFSSQPAPLKQLVPVTLNIDGQTRSVMATPQEAEMVRHGQVPPVRSFNVGSQSVPWYAFNEYDPYRDYWSYQNNGWRGVAGGAIAGFIGAEVFSSLFSHQPYWGGGWNSPYAYGPGWDSWGGWDSYSGGYGTEYDHGIDRAQSFSLQDPNYDGGASFMDSGPGYDASDYGSGDAGFMGGDNS
jgi:tetratricopeptide (TPR) repeat protein